MPKEHDMPSTGEHQDTLKVFVVDDHAIARRGIAAYLDVLDDMETVGEAVDGQDALDQMAEFAAFNKLPDVVLLDLLMPRLDGVSTLKILREKYPQVQVVILTSYDEVERMNTVMRLGAAGYLLKDAGPLEVASAIRAAVKDEVFIRSEEHTSE